MENNPYEGFDVGIFSNNMEAFSTVLKYEDFDSIFRNGIGEAGCFINTLYDAAFNTYVTDKIYKNLSDINNLAGKYGDLATKISECNKSYYFYKIAVKTYQDTPELICVNDANGQPSWKENPSRSMAKQALDNRSEEFLGKKRLVDEFDISVGGDN